MHVETRDSVNVPSSLLLLRKPNDDFQNTAFHGMAPLVRYALFFSQGKGGELLQTMSGLKIVLAE